MDKVGIQSILRCGQCNKPFDEQSTLKRHGYYCRSRRAGSTQRSRSCISCVKGKARCDNQRPGCSRCKNKAIDCLYPVTTSKSTRNAPLSDEAPKEKRRDTLFNAESLSIEKLQDNSAVDPSLDREITISNPEFTDTGEFLDWNDQDFDFTGFFDPPTNDETIRSPPFQPLSPNQSLIPSIDVAIQVQQAMPPYNMSIPATPTSTIRYLIQRPRMQTGAQRTASLMLHTMKSYPLMMLRHGTLPPFIHPHVTCPDAEDGHTEALDNCISLVYMISSGIRGSRKLFWKNVALECERLCDKQSELSSWELLAAMQALSIYILVRLVEGETDYNNFDFILHTTVNVISQKLARYIVACKPKATPSAKTSWNDWIFEESKRRLAVVYRVLNMLVYFEPWAMCDLQPALVLAPLPASKNLWEAADESTWNAEGQKRGGPQTHFGLAATGELLDIGEDCQGAAQLLHTTPSNQSQAESTANWEEWCSGMDGFGGLVMLTASLIV